MTPTDTPAAFDPASHTFGMAYTLTFTKDKYAVYPTTQCSDGNWLFYSDYGSGNAKPEFFQRLPQRDMFYKKERGPEEFNPDWACKSDCVSSDALKEFLNARTPTIDIDAIHAKLRAIVRLADYEKAIS